jgi:hypothetical protein
MIFVPAQATSVVVIPAEAARKRVHARLRRAMPREPESINTGGSRPRQGPLVQ